MEERRQKMEKKFTSGLKITSALTIILMFLLIRYNGGITAYTEGLAELMKIELFFHIAIERIIGLILFLTMLAAGITGIMMKTQKLCRIFSIAFLISSIGHFAAVYYGIHLYEGFHVLDHMRYDLLAILVAILQGICFIKLRKNT